MNPVCVFIPCHRVVAASGGLGGFSAHIEFKRRLLRVERAARTRQGRQALFETNDEESSARLR